MSHTRRSGTGSGYPQWMRTLEEKYQKLHKKITENTGSARFTSCVGKSVYDSRLSQALHRYKEFTTQKPIIRAHSSKVSAIDTNEQDHGNGDLPTDISKENWPNQYLHKGDTMCIGNENVTNGESTTENRVPSQDGSVKCEQVKLETASVKSEHSNREILLHLNDKVEENVGTCTGLGSCKPPAKEKRIDSLHRVKVLSAGTTNHISFDKSKSQLECDEDKLETDKVNRRNLKTSVSRTSKVTSKSCPPKLQANRLGQRQLLTARSKSANRQKMFTPMSEEAKHAITETIHEMNVSSTGQTLEGTDIKFVPSRGRVCVKSWVLPKKSKSSYDVRHVLESASQCLNELNADAAGIALERLSNHQDEGGLSSVESVYDCGRPADSRLPEIRNGSARERVGAGKNKSYRIPGIGKYDITNDDPVFEITPPGFDSRYNDMPPTEERESETPPPDIRQAAIEKCSEWLTKYNK